MPRLSLVLLLLVSLLLGSCASTTTVGLTTNQAPPSPEIGR